MNATMMPTVRCWLYVSNVSLSACVLDKVGDVVGGSFKDPHLDHPFGV
jgi:hypothetical protein